MENNSTPAEEGGENISETPQGTADVVKLSNFIHEIGEKLGHQAHRVQAGLRTFGEDIKGGFRDLVDDTKAALNDENSSLRTALNGYAMMVPPIISSREEAAAAIAAESHTHTEEPLTASERGDALELMGKMIGEELTNKHSQSLPETQEISDAVSVGEAPQGSELDKLNISELQSKLKGTLTPTEAQGVAAGEEAAAKWVDQGYFPAEALSELQLLGANIGKQTATALEHQEILPETLNELQMTGMRLGISAATELASIERDPLQGLSPTQMFGMEIGKETSNRFLIEQHAQLVKHLTPENLVEIRLKALEMVGEQVGKATMEKFAARKAGKAEAAGEEEGLKV